MRGTMHWRVDAVVLALVNVVRYSGGHIFIRIILNYWHIL